MYPKSTNCVFLWRLKFLLLLRGSICRDCHCVFLAIRDEIAAGESQDESDVQPSSSSGSNADWEDNGCIEQWVCALANLNLRWNSILQFILSKMAVLLVGEANPNLAQNTRKFLWQWTYVIYVAFGPRFLVWMVLGIVCSHTSRLQQFANDAFSACGGKKLHSLCVFAGGWKFQWSHPMKNNCFLCAPYWILPHHPWVWLLNAPFCHEAKTQ